jgi:hypothetical protein
MRKTKIGVIGTGSISDVYLSSPQKFSNYEIAGVADLNIERAQEQAVKHQIPFAGSVSELLEKEDIELIVNLTIPAAHKEVSIKSLQAGKHVYSEKPLATTYSDGGIKENRPYLCSGELGLHVLEVMEIILESSDKKRFLEVDTQCSKPEPLMGLQTQYKHRSE